MKHYKELSIQNIESDKAEILIALLSEIGFDGFEETTNELKAFAADNTFSIDALAQIATSQSITYTIKDIEEENWNALWEANFAPVVVDDFVAIRAHFHPQNMDVMHEIVITPKMSFGTGHHATTFMMMQQMRPLDFSKKKVLDFGTGTGVLAILATKLGAKEVLALDNDDWSIENTIENIKNNHCQKIEVKKAHTAVYNDKFDIILANINRNVIMANAEILVKQLNKGGTLLLSGSLETDEQAIASIFTTLELTHLNTQKKAQWISMLWSAK